jgi:glc operon protein GlcG
MNKYFEISVISHKTALAAVNAAIAEGQKQGVAVSVAVVDPNMSLVAFAKADGATPHSVETSRRKANTATSTKKKTGWMDDKLAVALPAAANNQLTNIPGGFPIKFDGKVVGGLGIAGGTVEQDATIAQATIVAIGADTE